MDIKVKNIIKIIKNDITKSNNYKKYIKILIWIEYICEKKKINEEIGKNIKYCIEQILLENKNNVIMILDKIINTDFKKQNNKIKLLPIMDPIFNLREISKQLILLEDHLFHIRKRCSDCIKKHFLTAEALSEEAITLDIDCKYNEILLNITNTIK